MTESDYPVWHPFTAMKAPHAPIQIERAKDCTLYAAQGKEYIDAISSWWVNIHGHANPTIAQRIAEQANQLEHVIFAGFTHTPAIDLANGLLKILNHQFAKVFFSDDGSTCVEVAIKMALQFWTNQGIHNKIKIIAFENAYHGDTFGAMSIGQRSTFTTAFQKLLFDVHFIPTPHAGNVEEVKETLTSLIERGDVAAFIFEPLVQGASGMLMHQAEQLDELIAVAHQHDIICIADEVMTGFGRTGKNFAIQHLLNTPDIICLSKGITGGFLPLGVTLCSQKIVDVFYSRDKDKTFYHGHSYTANPLACAAANASLQLLMEEKCQQQIRNISARHARFKEKILNNLFVREVRQTGTIVAFDLHTKENSSYFHSIRDEVYHFCLDHGVLLRPLGNVLYIMPPYCITEAELTRVYSVIEKLIETFSARYEGTETKRGSRLK
ncbi:MAG: adenosylmethionine--8-amino-7-oxononanoate transaminase [Bacteroidetes bacterium]|nr:adenosylmethionine--8-amino-7-oxononanoate transaminase [Bacteroidota bacterium]